MTIVPIEALTSARDAFRCVRLHCTLAAGVCVKRQATSRSNQHEGSIANAITCAACPDGERVARAIGERVDAVQLGDRTMRTLRSVACTTPRCPRRALAKKNKDGAPYCHVCKDVARGRRRGKAVA